MSYIIEDNYIDALFNNLVELKEKQVDGICYKYECILKTLDQIGGINLTTNVKLTRSVFISMGEYMTLVSTFMNKAFENEIQLLKDFITFAEIYHTDDNKRENYNIDICAAMKIFIRDIFHGMNVDIVHSKGSYYLTESRSQTTIDMIDDYVKLTSDNDNIVMVFEIVICQQSFIFSVKY